MSDKSYVAMGADVCPICYTKHNETVLLDKRLKDSLPPSVHTGWSLCPACLAKKPEFLALVEIANEAHKPDDAVPTGQYAHIKREVAARIFNAPLPPELPFTYVEKGVIDKLKGMMPHAPDQNPA